MSQNGADVGLAEEIALTVVNEVNAYNAGESIRRNYARKKVKGIYDHNLAIKGLLPIVEIGLKQVQRYRNGDRANVATKRLAAAEILDYWEDEINEKARVMNTQKQIGKPWFHAAKKGKTRAKLSNPNESLADLIARKDHLEHSLKKVFNTASVMPTLKLRMDLECDAAIIRAELNAVKRKITTLEGKKGKSQAKVGRAKRSRKGADVKKAPKKPKAAFGNILIKRVW